MKTTCLEGKKDGVSRKWMTFQQDEVHPAVGGAGVVILLEVTGSQKSWAIALGSPLFKVLSASSLGSCSSQLHKEARMVGRLVKAALVRSFTHE